MKLDSMREWLRPILGAALLLAGAAGVAYKVISGYQHAAPDAFISVQDQNKLPAASAANQPAAAPTVPTDLNTSPQSSANAAPALAPGDAWESASSVAAGANLPAEAQGNSACAAIKTEQREIEGALHKNYSAEEGRYMQRRLRELAEQLANQQCGE
jgi:hypothetical protein